MIISVWAPDFLWQRCAWLIKPGLSWFIIFAEFWFIWGKTKVQTINWTRFGCTCSRFFALIGSFQVTSGRDKMNDLGRLGGIKGWRKVPLPCQIRVLLSGQIHLNELIVRNTLATALFDHILQEWIFISLSCLKINRTKSQNFISQKSQTSKNRQIFSADLLKIVRITSCFMLWTALNFD